MAEERFCQESDRIDYFKGCELVVRAPGWYFWAGELSNMFGQPALIHQLNLWVYAGIEFWDENRFEIELKHVRQEVQLFNDFTERYTSDYCEKDKIRPDLKGGVNGAIELLDNWKQATGYKKFFRIKIWSDVPIAVGLNSSAAISACLGMLLYAAKRKHGNIPLDTDSYNTLFSKMFMLSPEALLKNDKFLEIFHTAWYFDNAIHKIFKSGVGPLASLIRPHGDKQLLLYVLNFGDQIPDTNFFNCPVSYKSHLKRVSKYTCYAQRFKIPVWFKRDVGFSLFFSGTYESITDGIDAIVKKQRINHKLVADLFSHLATKFGHTDTSYLEPLKTICALAENRLSEDEMANCVIYANALGFISLKIIECLLDRDSDPIDFFKLIRENYLLMKAYINIEDTTLGEAKKEIMEASNIPSKGHTAFIKLIGAGAGGDLLCFALRDHINSKINYPYYKGHFKKDVRLHYTSHTQGWVRGADISPVYNSLTGGEDDETKLIQLKSNFVFKFSENFIVAYDSDELELDETNFAIFLYLSAARKYGGDDYYLHKYNNLQAPKPGAACYFQTKDKIEGYFGDKYNLFRSSRRRDAKVYLAIHPDNLKFDKSLVNFASSHYHKLVELVNRAEALKDRGRVYANLIQTEDYQKSFMAHYPPFKRNTQLVSNAIGYIKWKLKNETEYQSLAKSSDTIHKHLTNPEKAFRSSAPPKPAAKKQ